MIHKSIDGRPLLVVKEYSNGRVEGVCRGSQGAIHTHNLEYCKIVNKDFSIVRLLNDYLIYFGWDIDCLKLIELGIINDIK